MRMRKCLVIAEIVLLLSLAEMGFASSSNASGGGDGCNPGRANNTGIWFNGMKHAASGGSSGGVRAQIYNYSPYVDQSDYGETAWVMFYNASTVNYAQIGWGERPGSVRNTFIQWGYNNGSGGYTNYFKPSYNINSTIWYKVTFDPSTNGYGFWSNGNEQIVSYNLGIHPDVGQIVNETHDQNSQMAGGVHNNEVFSSAEQYEPAGSGSWNNFNGTVESNPSWAGALPDTGATNVNTFNGWDKACTN